MPTLPNVGFVTYKFRLNSLLPLAGLSKCHNAETMTLTQGVSVNVRNEVAGPTAAPVITIFILSSCACCNYDPLPNAATHTPQPEGGEGLRLSAPHLHRPDIPLSSFFFPKVEVAHIYGVGWGRRGMNPHPLRQEKPAG